MTSMIWALQMPDFTSPEVWLSIVTLTFLEIVLGVDNIIFITIAANKLPAEEQRKARNIGLILAMIIRILLLFGIGYLIAMSEPILSIHEPWLSAEFSGQSLILIGGGIFLLYKATSEIGQKLEGESHNTTVANVKKNNSVTNVIIQITLINIVFSFDSILTAVGLTDNIIIMVFAVVFSMLIMMLFAGPVGNFVNKHPSIQLLGLSFLLLIGLMLILEGAHLAHLTIFGTTVGEVPKGYLYFAISFSLLVEFLNMRLRKTKEPVQLHGVSESAAREGMIDKLDDESY